MSTAPYSPSHVVPPELGKVLAGLRYWFLIGDHAVRCFCPYRPSRDVDLGVHTAEDLEDLVARLSAAGRVEILERQKDTVHLRFGDISVSIFVLENLTAFVEGRHLNITSILATKLHAILDRGTRRDFFDLYVILQDQRLGIAQCLADMREVYGAEVNEAILLRALTYFEDAEQEARLPGEGPEDWPTVKAFFLTRVGNLLVPPARALAIQDRRVDVSSR